jgi:hypothetical protein
MRLLQQNDGISNAKAKSNCECDGMAAITMYHIRIEISEDDSPPSRGSIRAGWRGRAHNHPHKRSVQTHTPSLICMLRMLALEPSTFSGFLAVICGLIRAERGTVLYCADMPENLEMFHLWEMEREDEREMVCGPLCRSITHITVLSSARRREGFMCLVTRCSMYSVSPFSLCVW